MNRIRELRKHKKLTQKELAKHLKIAASTLSYWETEKYEPDNESLRLLSSFFQVPIDYILGGNMLKWSVQDIEKMPYAVPHGLSNDQIDTTVKETGSEYEVGSKYVAFNRSEFDNLSHEDIEKLAEYAEFLKSQKKKR
jgi:transcriptional regulator with XRE-family HTH domain